jgi:hypothetical protein
VDTGFLSNESAVLGDTIKETLFFHLLLCLYKNLCSKKPYLYNTDMSNKIGILLSFGFVTKWDFISSNYAAGE